MLEIILFAGTANPTLAAVAAQALNYQAIEEVYQAYVLSLV
jgi:hypothetical protein